MSVFSVFLTIIFVCLSAASAINKRNGLEFLQSPDHEQIQQYVLMEQTFPTVAMDAREGSAETTRQDQFSLFDKVATPSEFKDPVIIRNTAAISADPFVKIFGPENSGTNFLYELLKKNNISTHGHSFGVKDLDDNSGWKHWPLQYAPSEMGTPDKFHIMLARHPLSWLLSFQKRNYNVDCKEWNHFQNCTFDLQRPFEKAQTNARIGGAVSNGLPPEALKSALDHEGRLHFDNLIQLWNLYYSGYLKTNTAGVIIRYEDLLVHPEVVLNRIGKEVDVDVGAYRPILGCAKNFCKNDGFENALYYNIHKRYMRYYRLSADVLKNIDELIDHSVLEALGYRL